MLSLVAAALLTATAPAASEPSVYFEQTARTTVDGTPAPAVHSRVYWHGKKARLESGDAFDPFVLLLDLARDRSVRLDAASKTAVVLDTGALRSESSLGFSLAGDAMGADDPDALRSEPLPGRKQVAGYVCEGHRIHGHDVRIDVWVSRAVGVPMSVFTDFLEWSGAADAMAGLLPQIQKLPGFPLETRSHLVTGEHTYDIVATITRIKTEPIPAATFEVPARYRTVIEPPSQNEPEAEP